MLFYIITVSEEIGSKIIKKNINKPFFLIVNRKKSEDKNKKGDIYYGICKSN